VADAEVERIALAAAFCVVANDDFRAVRACDLGSRIAAVVGNDEHAIGGAELRADRAHGRGDPAGFVVRGDDDGDARPRRGDQRVVVAARGDERGEHLDEQHARGDERDDRERGQDNADDFERRTRDHGAVPPT